MTASVALLFPGQGAQIVGMGSSFFKNYTEAKRLFEQADDVLHSRLSRTIFEGPSSELTLTRIAQPALFITSLAILAVIQSRVQLSPVSAAGLSLGEYTALVASGVLSFEDALKLVQTRASLMHEACERTPGQMLAILGLSDSEVIALVESLNIPDELWCANFNCPGQVVISGTPQAIETAISATKSLGARAVPLQTHGAFHSGLMEYAQKQLEPVLRSTPLHSPSIPLAMNVTGQFVNAPAEIRENLIKQVSSSVLWHQCVATCTCAKPDFFLEIGPGKTLAGMNKRMGLAIPTLSIESVEDFAKLETALAQRT